MNARSVICRLCLVADVQMFNLNNDNLRNCYYNLTGVLNLGMYPYICYECLVLLKRFGNFRSKCLTADQILKNVNINDVRKIDRELIGHTSNLFLTKLKTRIITIDNGNDKQSDIKAETEKNKSMDGANICNDEQKKVDTDFGKKQNVDFDKILDVDFHKTLGVDFDKNLDVDFEKNLDVDFYNNLDVDFDIDLQANVDENSDDSDLSFEEIKPDDNVTLLKSKNKKKVTQRNETKIKSFDYLKSVATITLLSPEESRKVVEEHKESSNLRSTYKCSFCHRGYYIQARLDRHVRKIHNSQNNFECDYCHRRYSKRADLRYHLEDCHTWRFQCNTCSHVCFDKYIARQHANKHTEKNRTCDLCGITFKTLKTMVQHKRTKHASNVLPCVLCGDAFSSNQGLKIHINVVHKGETEEPNGPYCDVCDVRFATDVALKRHFVLSDKHEDISCGCETCGEVFDNKSEWRRHAKQTRHVSTKNRTRWPIPCCFCQHIINNKDEYQSHIRDVHPNSSAHPSRQGAKGDKMPLVCELCGMQFKSPYFLNVHHQVKHRDERPFKCKICAKTFKTSGECCIHEGTHASVHERTCQLCGKVMKYRHNVQKHMKRIHTEVRPHKCPMCDRTFSSPYEVKCHVNYTHHKVPWPKPNRSKPRNRKKLKDTEGV